ncbi:transglycosylase domain-containing protein [Demequina sp. TTPB684]|uniref:penicillin-binding protein n=1 Tax=unclassified Demequina TaxID=2620311 RepID=UPI001CF17DBC|nr:MULTISPECIES: transglycosylase domain-containing protein [unclassified Demequina]MCB2413212.1 transglycosylase domain-containing protein [Demequina sp. TTPB684]UPU88213.1 transglycosylase domain-containing protein [Demequina sp. TMPB413]
MGLFTADRARRDGRVTIVQFVTSLAGFLLFSIMGGVLVAGLALPAVTVGGQAVNGTATLFESLPEEFDQTDLPQASSIYANDGTTQLATFYTQNRTVVTLEEISPWMQKAQVAIEDKRFWLHNGVDGEGLLSAAYDNLRSDDTRGASTITQQLVKNTLLQAAEAIRDEAESRERVEAATEVSLARKIKEWRLALAYEERLNDLYGTTCSEDPAVDCGKEQVLQQYLNIAQYGPSLYGVEAAARLYFGVSAKDLTAIQAATIAGITQNPTKWDPLKGLDDGDFEDTTFRRNLVLQAMHDQGLLTLAEYVTYSNTTVESTLNVTYPKFSCAASEIAPFFCDYVTKVIDKDPAFQDEGTQLLYKGGLKIVTTLDPRMQVEATDSLRRGVPYNDASGLENALVALDVPTGNILAMAQNRPFDPTSKEPGSTAINYAVDREFGGSRGFSPGSSFKPLVLAQWLDTGHSLSQTISGVPRTWEADSWRAACPEGENYASPYKVGNVYASENVQMSVLTATRLSVNTAFVAMTNQLDLCEVRDMALNLGFHRADGANFEVIPSVTLGSQNASPLTMASVYQTFANRGIHCEPRSILKMTTLDGEPVTLEDGTVIEPPAVSCSQVIRAEVADGVTHALTTVMESGTGRELGIGRPTAGKTGTAQNNTHLWFVGYTPQLVSAVWTGNADGDIPLQGISINGSRVRAAWYGGDVSGPIWQDFMATALEPYPVVGLPTASDVIVNGAQLRVPMVVGLPEKEAQWAINDAGFQYNKSTEFVYQPGVPAGQIVQQQPEADATMRAGGTVTYYMSTDQLPGWWYNWPAGWDPLVAPADWWGGAWPPPDWTKNNPSQGWDPTPKPPPNPTPEPPNPDD